MILINTNTFKKYWLPCVSGVLVCLIIAFLSGWITHTNINPWFDHLQKPSFNPPSWLFGPIWTTLYIMIGISGGIAYKQRHKHKTVWYLFILQLILNFAWSFIFFGAQQIGWALLDMTVLVLSVIALIIIAWSRQRLISYLLIPYGLWLTFAFLLNTCLWHLN